VAVSALFVLPTRWAIMVFAGLLLAPLPLAVAQGAPLSGPYIVVALAWRTLSSFVIIWLACAVRQLDAARVRLAEDAVVRERLRIDTELRGALGESLESIVSGAEHACALAADATGTTEDALRELIDHSRRTLAAARRMVTGYQQVSLRAEFDTAAALLSAAGISARVELPEGELADRLQDHLRSQLRSLTAELLGEGPKAACAIVVVGHAEQARLELRSEPSISPEVPGTTR